VIFSAFGHTSGLICSLFFFTFTFYLLFLKFYTLQLHTFLNYSLVLILGARGCISHYHAIRVYITLSHYHSVYHTITLSQCISHDHTITVYIILSHYHSFYLKTLLYFRSLYSCARMPRFIVINYIVSLCGICTSFQVLGMVFFMLFLGYKIDKTTCFDRTL